LTASSQQPGASERFAFRVGAAAYAELGRFDEAVEDATRATELGASDAALAWVDIMRQNAT
jgi:hypothetical protein